MYQSGSDPTVGQPSAGVAQGGSVTSSPAVTSAASAADVDVPARAFITELVHAMQATAERQREATSAEVVAITTAHLERVRARAAAEAEELRRMAQEDVADINAWQEAEAERIRAEAARRIVARGEDLDGYLARHAALIDSEVGEIQGVVAGYQLQLDDYFNRLTTETSPGEIARLADQMPEPPDLARVGGDARAKAVAAVAAEPIVAAEPAEFAGPAEAAGSAAAAEPEAAFSPGVPGPDLVPVMDPAATGAQGDPALASAGAVGTAGADAGPLAEGPNGEGQGLATLATRLLRTIRTIAAPVPERGAPGATAAVDEGAPEAVEVASK